MSEREERFEQMLKDIRFLYEDAATKMAKLKAEGREKSATYRQYMGNKLMYQNILSLYRQYGLME